MSKKLKFKLNNQEFTLPISSYREDTWGSGTEKYIHMSAKNCASVIKQYVKKNFPKLVCSATSDVYSGGSSVRVNVCKKDGSKVDSEDFKKIEQWKWILAGGSFNGMEDIYEYREDKVQTELGMQLKYFPSYIFIENKPNWGSKEYWMSEWSNWLAITDLDYHMTENEKIWTDNVVNKYGGWLGYNKQYMTPSVLKNIDSIMGCNK